MEAPPKLKDGQSASKLRTDAGREAPNAARAFLARVRQVVAAAGKALLNQRVLPRSALPEPRGVCPAAAHS